MASHNITSAGSSLFVPRNGELCLGDMSCVVAQAEIMKFAGPGTQPVPIWLAATYLVCNTTLNALNFYWFGRMIETVTKRFQGKPHDEFKNERDRTLSMVEEAARGLEHDVLSGTRTPTEERQGQASSISLTIPDGGTEISKRRKDLGS